MTVDQAHRTAWSENRRTPKEGHTWPSRGNRSDLQRNPRQTTDPGSARRSVDGVSPLPELHYPFDPVSDKVLTETLRRAERDGLVIRHLATTS